MSLSIALLRIRSRKRRKKPWRPETWFWLYLSVICYIGEGLAVFWLIDGGTWWLIPIAMLFLLVYAQIAWREFQRLRREDERD